MPKPGTGGVYPLTLTAGTGRFAQPEAFTLTVDQPASFTSPAAVKLAVGEPASFVIKTAGFPSPSLSASGTLPAGMSFTDNGDGTATLAGIPQPGGSGNSLTITAHNGVGADAMQTLTITLGQAPTIVSAPTATFGVGQSVQFEVAASPGVPGPIAITEHGKLPAGLAFSAGAGGIAMLGGIAAANTGGSYPITLAASTAGFTSTQAFTIIVDQPLAIHSARPAALIVGSAAALRITAAGFPQPSLSTSGALPAGVSFVDNGNGTALLTGVPAPGSAGSYAVTITASNDLGATASRTLLLTVRPAPTATKPPRITSAALATFAMAQPGTFLIKTTGLPAAAVSIAGTAPPWLTLTTGAGGTALLTGTPPALSSGVYHFTLVAQNGVGSPAQQSFTLTVDESPIFTSTASKTFAAGIPVSFAIATTGTPTAMLTSQGTLPRGIRLVNNHNGTLTLIGTPAKGSQGSYTIVIAAVNGVAPAAVQHFTLTID